MSLLHLISGYRSSDNTSQPLRLDKATNTIQTINYEHHEVHAGSHFFYSASGTLASGGTLNYLIVTPDSTKWSHMVFSLDGSAITQWDIYEASARTAGTLQTVFNSDRNSATTASVLVYLGYSGGTTDGMLISTYKGGSASGAARQGTSSRDSEEKILKQNTQYLLRVTSGTNDNLTNVRLNWYEHTNIA